MATTKDFLQKAEQNLQEELIILKDSNVGKERKAKARKNIRSLEKYLRENADKEINGKHYPKKEVPPKTTKEELYKLIDSVDAKGLGYTTEDFPYAVDLSGVSPGQNRFVFQELG